MQKQHSRTLLIIKGVPGSGKTTIAKALILGGLFNFYYEADMYFVDSLTHKYIYDKTKIKEAHDWCYNKVERAMRLGYMNVIVSNTSTSLWQYKKYLDLAMELGYNIQEMVLSSDFKSEHDVPETTINRMRGELLEDFVLRHSLNEEVHSFS